ncbi:MAG: hypothetical protein AAGD43_02570 [Pseudomonadota bacterium]
MRELIATIAGYTTTVCLVLMLVSWTIEAAAKGHAVTAAIVSPFAVLAVVLSVFWLASKNGWITT